VDPLSRFILVFFPVPEEWKKNEEKKTEGFHREDGKQVEGWWDFMLPEKRVYPSARRRFAPSLRNMGGKHGGEEQRDDARALAEGGGPITTCVV
jgi:hypothetical protein